MSNEKRKTDLKREDRSLSDTKRKQPADKPRKQAASGYKPADNRSGYYILGGLIALLLVLIILLIWKFPDQEQENADGEDRVPRGEFQELLDLSQEEAQRFYPYGESLLRLTPDYLTIFGLDGQEIYATALEFEKPVAVADHRYIIAADRTGGSFIVLHERGEVFREHLDGMFAGAFFSADSYLAVIEEAPDQPGYVHIYSLRDGQKKFKVQFSESGYPLCVSFSPDEQTVNILLLNAKGRHIRAIVKQFDITGKAIGQYVPDEYNDLFVTIHEDNKGNLLLCGNRRLVAISGDSVDALEFDHAILQTVDLQDGTAMVVDDGNGETVRLCHARADLQTEFVQVDGVIRSIASLNNYVAYARDEIVGLYDAAKNEILWERALDADIVHLTLNEKDLIAVTNKGVRRMAFK